MTEIFNMSNEFNYLRIIENIVRVVIDKVYVIQKKELLLSFEIDENKKIKLSEIRILNDVMTDLVTNKFLETDASVAKFLQLIIGMFEYAIKTYIFHKTLQENQIHFVYKGGNVLRIIIKEFLYELPGRIADILEKYYNKEFKKSDVDFSIYIDPLLPNFEEVFEDITTIVYLILSHIRIIFILNGENFFDFYKLNDNLKRNILLEYFKKLQTVSKDSEPIINLLVGEKSNRQDSLVEFNNSLVPISIPEEQQSTIKKSSSSQYGGVTAGLYNIRRLDEMAETGNILLDDLIINEKAVLNGGPTHFYISINKALKFKLQDLIMRFNLVRMKVNFSATFNKNGVIATKNIAGELIDISILHQSSHGINHFFQHLEKNIKTFTYETNSEYKFQFKATSKEYLTSDLEMILFSTVNYPWEDNKYGKRIKRLLCLYLVDMLSSDKKTNIKDTKNYIYKLETDCVSPLISSPSGLEYNMVITKIIEKLNYYQKYASVNNYGFAVFLEKYKNLLSKLINNLNKDNFDNLKNFVILIKENLDIYLKVLYELLQYTDIKHGKINPDQLYDVTHFGGNGNKKKN